MAKFGDAIRMRIKLLEKKGADIPQILKKAQEGATLRAIETAKEKTPPNKDTPLRGTGAITGDLKSSWEEDSQATPKTEDNEYTTVLANNKDYASYVNDGHRMDKHFVPGLYISDDGLLSKGDPNIVGGLMVGTKTQFVPGIFMKEAGIAKYEEVLKCELDKVLKELYKQ
jgi:hypothetical protein